MCVVRPKVISSAPSLALAVMTTLPNARRTQAAKLMVVAPIANFMLVNDAW